MMVDISLLSSGLVFLGAITWPILLAILFGGLFSALIQSATQISDHAISVAFKLVAAFAAMYFLGVSMFSKIAAYTSALWGSADFFH